MNPSDNSTATTIEKTPQTQPPAEQDPAGAGQQQQQKNKVEKFDGSGGSVEAHETDHEALRFATNLDNLPASGASAAVAHKASIEAESGEGSLRTRLVSIDTGDKVLTGGLAGNQLITPTGDRYSVQPNDQTGTYQVQKLGDNTSPPTEGKMTLLTNAFSLDSSAQPTFKPKTEAAEQSAPQTTTSDAPPRQTPTAPTGSGSGAAPLNGEAFYNQYKGAQTPEERMSLAGQYNSMNADQQAQFRNEVQAAAQKDDRTSAIAVITQLRQDVRSTADKGGEGSSQSRENAQSAGGDRPGGDGHAGQASSSVGQRQTSENSAQAQQPADLQGKDAPQQQRQDAPQPQPRQDAPQPQPRQDAPQPQPRQDAPQPQPRQDAPQPQPRQDAPQPQPRQDAPQPQPRQDAPQPQPRQDAPQPQPRQDAPQPQPHPEQQQHQEQQRSEQQQQRSDGQQQQRTDAQQQQQRADAAQQQQQRADSPQQRPAPQNIDQTGPKNVPGQQGSPPPIDQAGGAKPSQSNPDQHVDHANSAPKSVDQNLAQRQSQQNQPAEQAGARQGQVQPGDQTNRTPLSGTDVAAKAQNPQGTDRGQVAAAQGQGNERVVNAPPANTIDKVQVQPAQTVVADHDKVKPPSPGNDKIVGAGTASGAPGSDRTAGTGTTAGATPGENRTLPSPGGGQIPGTDLRVVQLNSTSNDARVQQIMQNSIDKQSGAAGKDVAQVTPFRDNQQIAGREIQPPGAVARPGQPADSRGVLPPGEQKPVVQVPDVRQLAPELANKVIDVTARGQLPVEQATRLTDTSGKVQQQALDGAIKQAQDAARGDSAVKGGVSQAGDAATLGRSTADGSALVQAQRTGIPGLDLKNPQDQQFLGNVIKQLQTANIKDFNPQTQTLKDTLTGLDPSRVDKLQAFFQQTSDATKGGALTGAGMVSQLGRMLVANRDTAVPGQLSAGDKLGALLHGQPAALTGSSFLSEMTRALGDLNRQLGVEGGQNAIGMNALTARSLTQLDPHGTTMNESFLAHLTPAQENLIRNLIGIKQDGKPDAATGAKIETSSAIGADARAGKITDAVAALAGTKGKEDAAVPGAKLLDDKDKELDKATDEKEKKPKEKEDDDITTTDKRRAALLALMAARKLKEDKEKALKEKEKAGEKDKKKDDEGKRTQYTVRERDTLQSVALRQLRDVRLAPLIYEINKSVIPIVRQRGRDIFVLKAGQVIWLPSVLEVREFRAKLASAAMNQQQQLQSQQPQSQSAPNSMTPEQELAARFGANWSGEPTSESGDTPPGDAHSSLISEAVEADRVRRGNIERLLGPISEKKVEEDNKRIRYVIRLGDTLKSVAMKHPALEDVSLWKLIAEVNNIPLDADGKGSPAAKLSRGTVLELPAPAEIEAFRNRLNATENQQSSCPSCGLANQDSATVCSGCNSAMGATSTNASTNAQNGPDAATIVLQAAGFVSDANPEQNKDGNESEAVGQSDA